MSTCYPYKCSCKSKCTCTVPSKIPGTKVYYTGSYLENLEIVTNTNLNDVLAKIDEVISTIISGFGSQKLDLVVGEDVDAGNTITPMDGSTPILQGKTVLLVIRNNMPEQNYTFTSGSGTLNFTSIGGVFDGDKITVIYN